MEIVTLRHLALEVRRRRTELGLTQAELAARARVSRQWVSEFEGGKPTAELGRTLHLLDALDLRLHLVPAEQAPPADPDAIDLDALLDDLRYR